MSFLIHIPDHLLFEDEYILLMNKPSGLMVEPDRNGHPNLLQQVQKYLRTSSSIKEVYAQHIHRLDRPVSGIVLFAKQKAVLRHLSEQFAERRVEKHYQALTLHSPALLKGSLEHWHRKEKKKAQIVPEGTSYAEKVKLDYEVTALADGSFLWDIQLHTGKFHQIRAQLSEVGCPIWGDHMYGSDQDFRADAIALHACKLVFKHPITEQLLRIEAQSAWHNALGNI